MGYRRFVTCFALAAATCVASADNRGRISTRLGGPESLRLYSFNLHGYHPTDEPLRFFEDRQGRIEPANSDLFFFTWPELTRGHDRRMAALTRLLRDQGPEIILLQEVGAGSPYGARDCRTFENPRVADPNARNIAFRLEQMLRASGQQYEAAVACRGNVGWTTGPATFRDRRIVVENPAGGRSGQARSHRVVFDFGSNPYPRGILVEGMAALVRAPWRIVENRSVTLPTNGGRENIFVQLLIIASPQGRQIALINVHLGHKVRHFEQGVAIQSFLSDLRRDRPELSGHAVVGDFNALLYRPRSASFAEVSTIAWEGAIPTEYDFRLRGPEDRGRLSAVLGSALADLNDAQDYKPWANLPSSERWPRIRESVEAFLDLQARAKNFFLSEVLGKPCTKEPCHRPNRIDQIWVSSELRSLESSLDQLNNDWRNTIGTLSDHPAIRARIEVR